MPTVGLVTIGQSPRTDIVPAMRAAVAGQDIRLVEAGALDELSPAEIERLAPTPASDVVVSRLRNGREVQLDKGAILDHIQRCITRLDREVDVHILLCTGAYPAFSARHPVLDADRVVFGLASGLHRGNGIGVLIPNPAQRASTIARWQGLDPHVSIGVASPYAVEPLPAEPLPAEAMRPLTDAGLVVMACFGYTPAMRATVREHCRGTVLLPSTILIHAALAIL